MPDTRLAAVLIDFENIFYYLREQLPDSDDITELVTQLVQKLKQHLNQRYGEFVISLDAYADFERIDENAQGELYLLGVETHNVLGTDHKNAADMRLCIDTMDILYTRQDIQTFVLVAGDRDYIPVIQHLKKRGKTVRVVGFLGANKSVSGDLIMIAGSDFIIDATEFVPELAPAPKPSLRPAAATGAAAKPGAAPWPPKDDLHIDWSRYELSAIEVMFQHFGDKPEIWLVPYLHKLRAEFSELTEAERKNIISRLETKGVISVQKRAGTPNDYSVIIRNWNHQLIRERN